MSTPYPLSRRADRLRARRAARRMVKASTDQGIEVELAAVKTVLGVRNGITDPGSCFRGDGRSLAWWKKRIQKLKTDEQEDVCALVDLDGTFADYVMDELPLVRQKTLPHQLCYSRESQVEKVREELEQAATRLKNLRSRLVEWSGATERETRLAFEIRLVRHLEDIFEHAEDAQAPLAARTARVRGEVCVLCTQCAAVYLPRLARLRDRYRRGAAETPAPRSLSCSEVLEEVLPPLEAYVADPESQPHPRHAFWGKNARTDAAFAHAEQCGREGCKELATFFRRDFSEGDVARAPKRFRGALARARKILRERRDVLATTTP